MKLGTTLINSIKRGGTRLVTTLKRPFLVLERKIKRILSADSIVNKVVTDVQEEVKSFTTQKPVSLKDYFEIGKYYVLKKLVYFLLILLMFAVLSSGLEFIRKSAKSSSIINFNISFSFFSFGE